MAIIPSFKTKEGSLRYKNKCDSSLLQTQKEGSLQYTQKGDSSLLQKQKKGLFKIKQLAIVPSFKKKKGPFKINKWR